MLPVQFPKTGSGLVLLRGQGLQAGGWEWYPGFPEYHFIITMVFFCDKITQQLPVYSIPWKAGI